MANKTHKAYKRLGLRTSALAVASCLVLSGVPLAAQAAGLGKIVVFSALGQPLRAEIELSATREELADMRAQLASPDAFKQAGLDYATTLLGIRFSLDKRNNGQSVIRLSSDKPINDPFVDMLLELNWPAGRLVREYTFLLDPPEIAAKSATAAPVVPPSVKSAGATPSPRAPAAIDDDVRGKAIARVRNAEPAQKAAERSADGQNLREVKRGDTLHRIASESKPEGVSLEQMLVGLLRANQDAFDGGNMNRLKAGKILTVPDKSEIEALPAGEAKKIVLAQSSDWNAYRSKLAGVAAQAPSKEESAKQDAVGKITAKVEDKAAPAAEPKDQLKVSKTDASAAKSGAASKRSDEEQIAREKALKEANERLLSLEKNVSELQKLIELKNQNLAELQKQAAAKPAAVDAKKPVAEPKPAVPPPAPVAAVAPPAKVEPPVVDKPAEPKPVEAAPAPKPVEAPKPVAKPPAPPPPAPPEEPGFLSELLDNPLALAGGGGILALIAGFFIARRRRASKEEVPLNLGSTLTPQGPSLTANSVFRSTGGQSVDTSHTPAQTDFSQAGPGSIDTDEVDPVAEADVYMAYGRDVQAEEILIEARQKDPKRYAIHLKLLEIYSNRKDLKQFETLATDLYGETGGLGADWEKAAAMGLKLDPGNPLFGTSAQSASASFDADATVIVPPSSVKNTVSLPGELSVLAATAVAMDLPEEAPEVPETPAVPDLDKLDFDLGFEDDKPAPVAALPEDEMVDTLSLAEPAVETAALDFDLGGDTSFASTFAAAGVDKTENTIDFDLPASSADAPSDAGSVVEAADLDFDLGIESAPVDIKADVSAVDDSASSSAPALELPSDDSGVEFDVSLTESTFLGRSMPEPNSFDMSAIDLDLNEPAFELPEAPVATDAPTPLADQPDTSEFEFDSIQVATAVNPDFSTEQAETVVSPSFGLEPELLPEQDYLAELSETVVVRPLEADSSPDQGFDEAQAATQVNPQFGVEPDDMMPEFDISSNEEVSTKLDLAKAYEEMGDLEGARELLHEVVKEGDATQREKAQGILTRIGD